VHKHHGHRGGDDGQEEVRYCDNLQTCMSKRTISCEVRCHLKATTRATPPRNVHTLPPYQGQVQLLL
jgi:hypothetical protein